MLALDAPERLQAALPGAVVEIVAAPPRVALRRVRDRLGPDRAQLFGDRLHVRVERSAEAGALADWLRGEGLEVAGVREIVPTLEDVFIEQLTGSTGHTGRAQPIGAAAEARSATHPTGGETR